MKSIYYDKYIKYKLKYTKLIGGNRYKCIPDNKFIDICSTDDKGNYKSKESCINDCTNKYITSNLIKSKLKYETNKFKLFINELDDNNIKVYIKGGTVLGLNILKMIYDKYGDTDKFNYVFYDFIKLNLIRDWDFAGYTKEKITNEYRKKLDKIANKYKFKPGAKTFIRYELKGSNKINSEVLYEISIINPHTFSKLEIPLTDMKFKINKYNINYLFMLSKVFYSYNINKEEIDLDIIKYISKKLLQTNKIYYHKSNNGMFQVNNNDFDNGNLSKELLELIYNNFDNINEQQFLITHIISPERLFIRLPDKNLPKTIKIKNFIKKHNLDNKISWLLDTMHTSQLVDKFIKLISNKLVEINNNGGLESIEKFLQEINLNRFKNYHNKISDKGKNMIKIMFGPLFEKVKDNLNNDFEIGKTLKFLSKKNIL